MDAHTTDYAAARKFMTEGQIRPNDITDRNLLGAFLKVPRENFVDPAEQNIAYAERAIPLNAQRQILPPLTVAKMIQALEVAKGETLLDIGGAPGYTAALLSDMGAHVTILEEQDDLIERTRTAIEATGIENVTVVKGQFKDGYASTAPYDAIVLEGSIADAPDHLINQLKEGGRLIALHVSDKGAKIMLYKRTGAILSGVPVFAASAPFLAGYEPARGFVF